MIDPEPYDVAMLAVAALAAVLLVLAVIVGREAHAGPPVDAYLDVSVGWAQGLVEDVHLGREGYPVDWTDEWGHAQVEVGVVVGDTTFFAQHISSPLTTHDQGVDFVGVRHRIWRTR